MSETKAQARGAAHPQQPGKYYETVRGILAHRAIAKYTTQLIQQLMRHSGQPGASIVAHLERITQESGKIDDFAVCLNHNTFVEEIALIFLILQEHDYNTKSYARVQPGSADDYSTRREAWGQGFPDGDYAIEGFNPRHAKRFVIDKLQVVAIVCSNPIDLGDEIPMERASPLVYVKEGSGDFVYYAYTNEALFGLFVRYPVLERFFLAQEIARRVVSVGDPRHKALLEPEFLIHAATSALHERSSGLKRADEKFDLWEDHPYAGELRVLQAIELLDDARESAGRAAWQKESARIRVAHAGELLRQAGVFLAKEGAEYMDVKLGF